MDTPVLPLDAGQRGPASASCAGYNIGNFFRTLVLPDEVERWSLTTLREKVVKIGAKVIAHARYTTFQVAEVAVPRDLFRRILARIDELRPKRIEPC